MGENFPNLGREIDVQIHEVQRIPDRSNPKNAICQPYHVNLMKTTKENL